MDINAIQVGVLYSAYIIKEGLFLEYYIEGVEGVKMSSSDLTLGMGTLSEIRGRGGGQRIHT